MRFRPSILASAVLAATAAAPVAAEQLFSTLPGVTATPFLVSSQLFTDTAGNQTVAADDFTVAGSGWRMETVQVQGGYFNGAGPATSVNVYILGNAGINVEYMYAFVQKSGEHAVVIFRFEDLDRAVDVIQRGGYVLLSRDRVLSL